MDCFRNSLTVSEQHFLWVEWIKEFQMVKKEEKKVFYCNDCVIGLISLFFVYWWVNVCFSVFFGGGSPTTALINVGLGKQRFREQTVTTFTVVLPSEQLYWNSRAAHMLYSMNTCGRFGCLCSVPWRGVPYRTYRGWYSVGSGSSPWLCSNSRVSAVR